MTEGEAGMRAGLLLRFLPDAVIRFNGRAYKVRDQSQKELTTWIISGGLSCPGCRNVIE